MYSRVARYRIPEDKLDEAIRSFEDALRELGGLSGLERSYLLVDRDNSTALSVTFWESRAALEASEVTASRLRSQAMGALGGEVVAVDRCEVALESGNRTTA